jgi:hypothetical protein
MSQFRVNFALSTDPNATESSGFASDTNSNNLETVVEAIGMSQARTMVESMYGGPVRCWVKSVIPL